MSLFEKMCKNAWQLTLLSLVMATMAGGLRVVSHMPLIVTAIVSISILFVTFQLSRWLAERPLKQLAQEHALATQGSARGSLWDSPIVKGPSILGFAIALATTAAFLTHNAFSLRSTGNADAAFHVRYMFSFESKSAAAYHGFSVFYTLCIFLKELFGINVAMAHLAGLTGGFFLLTATLSVVLLPRIDGDMPLGLRAASAALLIGLIWCLIFPLYNQFFLQGGYVHTFGAVTYPLLVVAYASSEQRYVRVLFLLLGVGMLRFMYGLNLPDCALGGAILIIAEAIRTKSRSQRMLMYGAFIALAGISVASYVKLLPRAGQSGAGTQFSLQSVWALYAVSALMALACRWTGITARNPFLTRVIASSTALFLSALVVQLAFFASGKPLRYYMLKHAMYPLLVITVLHGAIILDALRVESWHRGIVSRVLACLSLFILIIEAFILSPILRDTFESRSYAVVTQQEWSAIESVLERTEKRFGGYLAPSWPAAHYINEAFGRPMGISALRMGMLDVSPETCVFWPTGSRREELRRVAKSLKGSVDSTILQLERFYEKAEAEQFAKSEFGVFSRLRIKYLCPQEPVKVTSNSEPD
jgi:hypothetical protein